MVYLRFIGGLGNQMFQYAFYRRIKALRDDVIADITGYELYQLHNGFEIEEVFGLSIDKATKNEIIKFRCEGSGINNIVARAKNKFIYKVATYDEKTFDESVLNKEKIYLDGYWQSEKYFSNVSEELKREFKFKGDIDDLTQNISKDITSCHSVSVHIRRGDYVANPVYSKYGYEYYIQAMNYLKDHGVNPVYFVFSDDIEWVKTNIIFNGEVCFIDHNKNKHSYKDMYLMSLCRHNIIANSSFSWWGAWLNKNPNKIIISPRQWFSEQSMETIHSNIVPENWVKL